MTSSSRSGRVIVGIGVLVSATTACMPATPIQCALRSVTLRGARPPGRARRPDREAPESGYAAFAPSRLIHRVAPSLSYLAPQPRRGEGDSVDDELVAGAAAEVAGDGALDLVARRRGVALQQVQRRHQHTRRTVAALQRVRLVEGLLERVEDARGGWGRSVTPARSRG